MTVRSTRRKKAAMLILPSPSVRRIATSAEEPHQLNSVAPLATILNDVVTFSVGGAFLKLHCLFAYNAVQETYQPAFIVVQRYPPGSLPLRLQPESDRLNPIGRRQTQRLAKMGDGALAEILEAQQCFVRCLADLTDRL